VHQIPADSTARTCPPFEKLAALLLPHCCYWLSQRKTEQADDQGAAVSE
jgi:phage gp36-like protein